MMNEDEKRFRIFSCQDRGRHRDSRLAKSGKGLPAIWRTDYWLDIDKSCIITDVLVAFNFSS